MKMQLQMVTVISLLICLLLTSPLPLPVSGETRQTFIPKSLPATLPAIPVTVPASPEQSSFDACPLDLQDQAFHDIGIACGPTGKIKSATREQCCPVLSAWFYAAYARTALARTAMLQQQAGVLATEAATAELEEMMPVLPDDSESCVEGMQRALKERKVEISVPVNETCDLFFCYCGIRLVHRPVSVCPSGEFWVSKEGRLSAGEKVVELERSCSSTNNNIHYSFASCNKCLQTLYKLKGTTINGTNSASTSKNINNNEGSSSTIISGSLSWRKGRMRSRDCEMMGLTWILAKNQTQYVRAVSGMLGALMEDPDGQGTDPTTCNPNQLQLPLAVDSPPIDRSDGGCGMQQQQLIIYIVLLIISALWWALQ